jgi:hypothetical protein
VNIQGCLSETGGSYILTDPQGKRWSLTGNTDLLSQLVGHRVALTGTVEEQQSSGGKRGNGAAQEPIRFRVESMTDIGKDCTNETNGRTGQ